MAEEFSMTCGHNCRVGFLSGVFACRSGVLYKVCYICFKFCGCRTGPRLGARGHGWPLQNACKWCMPIVQWRHNECDGVSIHLRLDCLLSRLFRRGSKKTSKLRVTGLFEGNPPLTGGSPRKRPVTRKMCPFDDVIMKLAIIVQRAMYYIWWLFLMNIMWTIPHLHL